MNHQMPKISENTNEGGCARTFVTIQGTMCLVTDLIPIFCSVFGMPDDCYSENFQKRMLAAFEKYAQSRVWCYKKTKYTEETVRPFLNLHYLQEEILPKQYFAYIDASENYLKGILSGSDLKPLRNNSWYESGSELVAEMDPRNRIDGFSNEDKAEFSIVMRLLFESIRLLLIRMNSAAFASFAPKGLPPLDYGRMKEVDARVDPLIESVRVEAEANIRRLMKSISGRLDWTQIRKGPFIVMDMEYIHSPYPTTLDRTFNFPCIFVNTLVRSESNISLRLFVNKLPCYYCCSYPCPVIKKTSCVDFDCLCYSRAAIDECLTFLERMIATHENLWIYSYGKSDSFEIEHAYNFFSDETEQLRFTRKNRVRASRITELVGDLSIQGKDLTAVENDIISKWLLYWKRKHQKVDVNPRFITPLSSDSWEVRFREALWTPIDDAISALLLLLYSRDSTNKTPEPYIELADIDRYG